MHRPQGRIVRSERPKAIFRAFSIDAQDGDAKTEGRSNASADAAFNKFPLLPTRPGLAVSVHEALIGREGEELFEAVGRDQLVK